MPQKKSVRRSVGQGGKERDPDYQGFKFLKQIEALLGGLRDESNPNRNLHFDHYVTWLLF